MSVDGDEGPVWRVAICPAYCIRKLEAGIQDDLRREPERLMNELP